MIEDCDNALSLMTEDIEREIRRHIKKDENGNQDIEVDKIPTNPALTRSIQCKLHMKRGLAFKELDEPHKGK